MSTSVFEEVVKNARRAYIALVAVSGILLIGLWSNPDPSLSRAQEDLDWVVAFFSTYDSIYASTSPYRWQRNPIFAGVVGASVPQVPTAVPVTIGIPRGLLTKIEDLATYWNNVGAGRARRLVALGPILNDCTSQPLYHDLVVVLDPEDLAQSIRWYRADLDDTWQLCGSGPAAPTHIVPPSDGGAGIWIRYGPSDRGVVDELYRVRYEPSDSGGVGQLYQFTPDLRSNRSVYRTFEQTFPDLAATDLLAVTPAVAQVRLAKTLDEARGSATVLGLTVPLNPMARYGLLVLAGFQCMLLLHMRQISASAVAFEHRQRWFLGYPDWLAFIFGLATVVLLPVGAAGRGMWVASSMGELGAIVGGLIVIWLSVFTAREFVRGSTAPPAFVRRLALRWTLARRRLTSQKGKGR